MLEGGRNLEMREEAERNLQSAMSVFNLCVSLCELLGLRVLNSPANHAVIFGRRKRCRYSRRMRTYGGGQTGLWGHL